LVHGGGDAREAGGDAGVPHGGGDAPVRRRPLARDIDALAADLAQVAAAELPDETEPAFFLLEGSEG
jgi:hypothetical protein